LFAEIRARRRRIEDGNQNVGDLQHIVPGPEPDDDVAPLDPQQRLRWEISRAANARLKRLHGAEGTIKQVVPTLPLSSKSPSGITNTMLSGIGLKSRARENDNKITRYKVMGLKCGEYKEDPNKPVDDVEIFSSFETCEEVRKYTVAREAIMNPVLKYGNEINEANALLVKLNARLAEETKRLERAKNVNDPDNIRNYTKSVDAIAADVAMAQDKKRKGQENYDANWDFMSTNIFTPLSMVDRKETLDFYLHLKRLKGNVESWTVDFVAQEYVNKFSVGIPGYEPGGVAGLTSAQVKKVIENSRLKECLTPEIMDEVMMALGAKTVLQSENEVWYDAVEEQISDVAKVHILKTGIDTVMDELNTQDPRTLSSQTVEKVLKTLDATELQLGELVRENPPIAIGDKATTVFGEEVDKVQTGKSCIMSIDSLVAKINKHNATSLAVNDKSELLKSTFIVSIPLTSSVTALLQSVDGIDITEKTAAIDFSVTSGVAVSLFPAIAILIETGAILFAIKSIHNGFLGSVPNSKGERKIIFLTIDTDQDLVTLKPVPPELENEVNTSVRFLGDLPNGHGIVPRQSFTIQSLPISDISLQQMTKNSSVVEIPLETDGDNMTPNGIIYSAESMEMSASTPKSSTQEVAIGVSIPRTSRKLQGVRSPAVVIDSGTKVMRVEFLY